MKSSPFFFILADVCDDISMKEELMMCSIWIRNGKLVEHFVNTLRVYSLDATNMTDMLCPCMESNNCEYIPPIHLLP